MTFTYDGYIELINLLKENRYQIGNYHDWEEYDRCVILRHDVDNDLQKALEMAELEYRNGIRSTYFVLLTSNFYNLYSHKSRKILSKVQDMGHTIGIHFDEMAYPADSGNANRIELDIQRELDILSEILGKKVIDFSYHRPTKEILDADISITGVVNAYGTRFFKEFKYLSDSRMHWREPVKEIIQSGRFLRLQVLTHPFWYQETEKGIKKILESYIDKARIERYDNLNDNFTKLDEVIKRELLV